MFSTRRLCLDFVQYSDKVVIIREDVDSSFGDRRCNEPGATVE